VANVYLLLMVQPVGQILNSAELVLAAWLLQAFV